MLLKTRVKLDFGPIGHVVKSGEKVIFKCVEFGVVSGES